MRRRPPFALVLVALVAALGGAFALLSTGGAGHKGNSLKVPSTGPAHTCVTARARATAAAKEVLRAPVSVTQPVSVTVQARGAAATVSENVVERAVATRSLEARRAATGTGRACAHGATANGARSAALTRAYRRALPRARMRAGAAATASVRAFAARQLPALVDSARRQLGARAQSAAEAVRRRLATEARARLP